MFTTIFRYEFRHWLRQPVIYIYAAFFLLIPLGTMWGMAAEASSEVVRIINSPRQINVMANLFNTLMLFLLPSIIGLSIYRDFQSGMYTLLYAFPFKKRDYLLAKLLSAVTMVTLIIGMIGLGFAVGAMLPGVNLKAVVPFDVTVYAQLYGLYLIPNILLFGAIVFAIVSFSRNIYAGFIAVILIIILQLIIESILKGVEWRYLAALLDPLGDEAVKYYTRHWTLAERNTLSLPIDGVIIYNRLLWAGIALAIFGFVFRYFSFQQQAFSLSTKKKSSPQLVKSNLAPIIDIQLPPVRFNFTLLHQLRTAWQLSSFDFREIVLSWSFISIVLGGLLAIFFQQAEMNAAYGFKLLPMTWKMLHIPSFIYAGLVNLITFLFAGLLIHRARLNRMNHLIDISPLPNWAFLLSKVIALVKIQMLLLSFIIIAGVTVQMIRGFYEFQFGLYFFEVYGLYLVHFIIWACLAICIQSLLTNPYLGFFLLLLIPMGMITLPGLTDKIGLSFLKQEVFWYNQVPGFVIGFNYSDLNQYGSYLPTYWAYKRYWLVGGFALLLVAYLFQVRGITFSFRERLAIAKRRLEKPVLIGFALSALVFISLGASIFLEENVWHKTRVSDEDETTFKVENEKRYKPYENIMQPRLSRVEVAVDLYPRQKRFLAKGTYTLINKSDQTIDTLLVAHSYREKSQYKLARPHTFIRQDSLIKFDVIQLQDPMMPGDSLLMQFQVASEDHSFFQTDPRVIKNGTFLGSQVFPKLGYRRVELTNNEKRKKHGLPPRATDLPMPSDSSALGYAYPANESDWIDLEAVVSTSKEQIALAPGILQKEWAEGNRRFFKFQTDHRIAPQFSFHSGLFTVKKDQWQDVEISVYHHPNHTYNLTSIVEGVKAALDYSTKYFGPYKHKELRIVEYPRTEGTYATVMGNLMPYSELYWIGDVSADGVDLPYYVSAHETAHHWWGHQVNPANIRGGKMVTEAMAEFVGLKVLEKRYGKAMIRRFLRNDLDVYLEGRANERGKETPLITAYPHQEYINYQKGALIFYALSDYLGEENLNQVFASYLSRHAYHGPPLPHSLGLKDAIAEIIPDSLSYLVQDFFETISIYDNKVIESEVERLVDSSYVLQLRVQAGKFRSDGTGNRLYSENGVDSLSLTTENGKIHHSLPLQDYIEIGVFGEEELDGERLPIYLKRHRITSMDTTFSIRLDQPPVEAGIDPYHKLIDIQPEDNRRKVD
ncbi:MAG: hypothetical protein KTR30_20185 [Saprospiraceae bacterium]|nr:hypothetical protein [Saprospiraceae bacterium]